MTAAATTVKEISLEIAHFWKRLEALALAP
jgi:hypothetical protein